MPSFVNPYTFIPLGRRSYFSGAGDESLTGVVSCRLTAMTPVIIPEGEVKTVDDAGVEYVNLCFRIDGEPAIPGSSLRGPIRSTYEALTNSCMRMNDKRLSSAGGRKLPGLLRWDADSQSFILHTARRYRVTSHSLRINPETESPWVTGDMVFVKTGPEADKNPFRASSGIVTSMNSRHIQGTEVGYYLRVNQMDGQTANSPSVFVEDERVVQPVGREYVDALRENVTQYVANANESGNPGFGSDFPCLYQSCLERMVSGAATLPVWYSTEKLRDGTYAFHFAWAQLSRNVYPKTTGDFVRALGLQPCSDSRGPLCPACELFGFVDQNGGGEWGAKAGRVRFTDARPVGTVNTSTYTLPPLLGPRIHAAEFYLRNQDHKQSFTPMTDGTQLAGRKTYWSVRDGIRELGVGDDQLAEGENRFAAKVEAIRQGSTLRFDVYFDGISRLQLNELVYTLTLGGEWGVNVGEQWHKIGHGKPVGAGSVLIEVERVRIRSCGGTSYDIRPWDDCRLELGEPGRNGTVLFRMGGADSVMRATRPLDLDSGTVLDYPRKAKGGDIFEWFAANHERGAKNDQTVAGYKSVLPVVNDGYQYLPSVPSGKSTFLSTPHPQTVRKENGTVDSVTLREDGRWNGRIRPDSGGGNIYFDGRENPHITSTDLLKKGARVEFETVEVENAKRGRRERHAVSVRIV